MAPSNPTLSLSPRLGAGKLWTPGTSQSLRRLPAIRQPALERTLPVAALAVRRREALKQPTPPEENTMKPIDRPMALALLVGSILLAAAMPTTPVRAQDQHIG